MANTYTWKVAALNCLPTSNGKTNVVQTIHWRCEGTDGTHNASVYSTCGVNYNEGEPFTEFNDLTESQIISWAWDHGVDRTVTETSLDNQLAALANPPIITPTLPWIVSSNVA